MKNALVIWIWFCAYLNCAGWFLSAIRQLNAAGYAVALVLGIALFFCSRSFFISTSAPHSSRAWWFQKLFHRFKRPFPLAFFILSAMIFIGGAIHAPNNYDGLTYRLPRVLHWLAADQWNWIHTVFPRVNTRACGIEWLSAPLIAIFKTDRLLFLINFISFLFLPGLVFSVLTRLGVRRRVAWYWMWIVPSGYCFLLQAGGIANDSFAAPFALAAVDFALRAKISKRPRDFFTSVLAAALLTGAKTGNVTLLLPWAIAILPSLKLFLQRPIATAAVCVMAIFSSFLPNAALNVHFLHDWSGLKTENLQSRGSVFLRTISNTALVAVLNVSPPVFPEADKWNRFVQKTIPPNINQELQETLTEPQAAKLTAQEMQMEENAGLGFGVTILLVVSVAVALTYGGKFFPQIRFHPTEALWQTAIVLSPWVSTFALVSQSEVYPIGRILAPYYVLLLPLLLAPSGHESLVKKTWWRVAAFVVFAMAAGLLIISPARPLFPTGLMLDRLQASHSDSKIRTRIETVYSIYRDRNHDFKPVLDILPPGVKVLGLITYDDPETSLWQPYGSRRIVHVCPGDSPAYLKANGVEYILAKNNLFEKQFPALDEWLKQMNASLIQKIQLNLRADEMGNNWYLIKLN